MADGEGQLRECAQGHVPGTAQELRNVRLGSSDLLGKIGLADLLFLHESRNQLRSLKRERFTLINLPTLRVGNEILEVILQLRRLFLAPRSARYTESSLWWFGMQHGIRLCDGARGWLGA